MFEALLAQPADMSPRPGFAARKDPIVAEQKRGQLLALHSQVEHRPLAGSDQVTHGLVRLVGNPDRGQFAGAVQARQRDGVAPVGLDPVTGADGDHRGCDHITLVSQGRQLTVQTVATGPGLIAEVQALVPGRQFLDQTVHGIGRTVDIAVETNFTAPASIGDRNRNLGLGCVQPDERFRFLAHGSTLVSRQAGQSQPLPLLLIA